MLQLLHMKKVTISTLILLLILAGSVTAHARGEWLEVPAGYTPADGIKYWAESLAETFRLWISLDQSQKAYRLLEAAEERVAETEALATRKQYRYINRTALKYQKQLESAELAMAKVKETSADDKGFKEKMAAAIIRHQAVLNDVLQRVPKENQETIETVLQATQNRYQKIMEKENEPTRARVTKAAQEKIPNLYEHLPQKMRIRVHGLIKDEDIKELETNGSE